MFTKNVFSSLCIANTGLMLLALAALVISQHAPSNVFTRIVTDLAPGLALAAVLTTLVMRPLAWFIDRRLRQE